MLPPVPSYLPIKPISKSFFFINISEKSFAISPLSWLLGKVKFTIPVFSSKLEANIMMSDPFSTRNKASFADPFISISSEEVEKNKLPCCSLRSNPVLNSMPSISASRLAFLSLPLTAISNLLSSISKPILAFCACISVLAKKEKPSILTSICPACALASTPKSSLVLS